MKRLASLLLAVLLLVGSAPAALTLLQRETFQAVGTLNSGTPGNLGVVTGSLYKRPGGPIVGSDTSGGGTGWSADTHNAAAYNQWTITGGQGANFNFMVCGWFCLGDISTDNFPGRVVKLLAAEHISTQVRVAIEIGNTLDMFQASAFAASSSTVALTKWGWVFLAIAGVYTPATYDTVTYRCYYMFPGGSLTQLGSDITGAGGMQENLLIFGGNRPDSNIVVQMRYGAPALYRIAGFSDVAVPSDLTNPPAVRRDWYINPSSGNDANDGVTSGTAWQTVAKLNAESSYLGMFPVATGYATGDRLHIDCSGAPLAIGTTSIHIKTRGLTVLQTGGALDPMTTLSSGGWTLASGSTKTYSSTDGGASDLASIVVFEDGKYLNKVSAASYGTTTATTTANGTSYTTTLAALDAAPGSFYCDGTTIYLHPFGDTNPTSDGKVYRRTRNRESGGSAVAINAYDIWWDGLSVAGTTLADKATNDPVAAYCLQWDTGAGGTNLLSNFSINHYSKHGLGRTAGGSNGVCTRQDGVYGQSSPYSPGGCTSDVDFSGDATSSGNVTNFIRCIETVNIGLIGSSAGTINTGIESYTSHASSVAFSQLNMTDCTWCGTLDEQSDIAQINLLRVVCSATGFATSTTFDQCKSTHGMLGAYNTGSRIYVARNCIMSPTSTTGLVYFAQLPTTATLIGCTIDLRGATGGGSKAAFGKGAATSAVTIRNCLLLTADTRGFVSGFSSADTLAMDHNAYANGGSDAAAISYNDGSTTADRTLAQWQALGFDSGSFTTTPTLANLDGNLVPQAGSPVVDAGYDTFNAVDYTGATFPHRNDVGALEYVNQVLLSGFFF